MLRNGLYNLAGATVRLLVTVIAVPLLIRLIGIESYGVWTFVAAVIGLAGLAEAGLSLSTTYFLARDLAAGDDEAISQTLSVSLALIALLASLACIVIILIAPALASLFAVEDAAEHASLVIALRLGSLVVFARLFQQVLVGIVQAHERYVPLNVMMTVQTVANSLGLLVIALLGGRAPTFVAWQVVLGAVFASVFGLYCHRLLRHRPLRWSLNRRRGRELGRYSLYMWLNTFGGALFAQAASGASTWTSWPTPRSRSASASGLSSSPRSSRRSCSGRTPRRKA
jgi:O-antigen/teichoic acid export membrane protein